MFNHTSKHRVWSPKHRLVRNIPETFKGLGLSQRPAFCPQKAMLAEEYDEAPEGILDYTLFGKTMYDLVRDGMNDKLMNIPPDAREKLSGVLERIINEGAGGLICILL